MNNKLSILFFCLFAIFSCNKENIPVDKTSEDSMTIGAYINDETKVYIDNPETTGGVTKYPIKWAANDTITLIHLNPSDDLSDIPEAYRDNPGFYRAYQFLMSDASFGGQKYACFNAPIGAARFSGFDDGELYVAIFPPAPKINTRSDLSVKSYGTGSVRVANKDGMLSYTIPMIQTYDPSSLYGVNYANYHMFAAVNGSNKNNIVFKPGQAVMALTLNNTSSSTRYVRNIVVTTNQELNQYSNNGFVGKAYFTLNNGELSTTVPEGGYSGGTSYTLTLNCNDVEILSGSSKIFGFMFLPGAVMGNLTFTITFSDETTMVVTKNDCPILSSGTLYKAKAYIRDEAPTKSCIGIKPLEANEVSF